MTTPPFAGTKLISHWNPAAHQLELVELEAPVTLNAILLPH